MARSSDHVADEMEPELGQQERERDFDKRVASLRETGDDLLLQLKTEIAEMCVRRLQTACDFILFTHNDIARAGRRSRSRSTG